MLALTQGLMGLASAAPPTTNTVALLHMDGTNGSTSFPDDTGKTWTANGNAQVTTTSPQFGTGAALFDGSGDWIDSASEADFGFGTGDFSLECFFRLNAVGGNQVIFAIGSRLGLYVDNFAQVYVFDSLLLTNILTSFNGAVVAGTYYHVEFGRSAGTMYLAFNGARQSTRADARDMGTSNVIRLGLFPPPANNSPLNGRVDEFRASRIARNPGTTYIVPTSPFTLD